MDLYKKVNGKRVKVTESEAAEIQAEWAEEEVKLIEKRKLVYRAKRLSEYPAIGEQLDMLYHAMSAGEIPVATEWFNSIKAVKDKHPKPE